MAGACAIIVWGVSASCVMFGTLKFLGKLRVSEQEERKGKIISKPNTNFVVYFQTAFRQRVQYVKRQKVSKLTHISLPFPYRNGTEIHSRVIHGVIHCFKNAENVPQRVLKCLDVEIHVIVKWRTVPNDQTIVYA
jgi:hypothetical protein